MPGVSLLRYTKNGFLCYDESDQMQGGAGMKHSLFIIEGLPLETEKPLMLEK